MVKSRVEGEGIHYVIETPHKYGSTSVSVWVCD